MKIVIAADIYPPDIGGPATYSQTLLQELPRHGVTANLICYSDKPGDDVIRVMRSGPAPWRYFKYYQALKKAARDADVIYAMGPVSAGLPAMWAAKKCKKKFVVKVVGDYAWEQARNLAVTEVGIDEFQDKDFGGKISKLQKIERQVCGAADRVIVPSQYLKKIVSGWGVDARKIEVVYNSFRPVAAGSASPRTEKVIVSVGRLVPWKGFETVIRLMKNLDSSFTLEIYGEGPERDKLTALIAELQLADRVKLFGRVSHQELIQKKLPGTILVLNTGYEGLSHTVLEAFAAGAAVVTTNVGGNPELVVNNETGLLVEYNNQPQLTEAIMQLSDDALRQRIVQNARKALERFTQEKMMSDTSNVLRFV